MAESGSSFALDLVNSIAGTSTVETATTIRVINKQRSVMVAPRMFSRIVLSPDDASIEHYSSVLVHETPSNLARTGRLPHLRRPVCLHMRLPRALAHGVTRRSS